MHAQGKIILYLFSHEKVFTYRLIFIHFLRKILLFFTSENVRVSENCIFLHLSLKFSKIP
jgi:hypothetical protein